MSSPPEAVSLYNVTKLAFFILQDKSSFYKTILFLFLGERRRPAVSRGAGYLSQHHQQHEKIGWGQEKIRRNGRKHGEQVS